MPVFFIKTENIRDEKVFLSGSLLNHIKNSLRYQVNDQIDFMDENKTAYRAIVTRVTPQVLEGTVIQKRIPPAPGIPPLILAHALVKKKNMEWILQKGTELGVSEFVPLTTERVVIHPQEERLDHQMERWSRILLEAAQQSEQPSPPFLLPPVDFKSFIREKRKGIGLIFWENERQPLQQAISMFHITLPESPVTLVIGPEGGFHPAEIQLARENGYFPVSLGKRKLRSETAVLAAVTLLQYELGYFG